MSESLEERIRSLECRINALEAKIEEKSELLPAYFKDGVYSTNLGELSIAEIKELIMKIIDYVLEG